MVSPNDNRQHIAVAPFRQGINSYNLLPCPVAVARQFGFCFAVYVRHPSGQIERRGLFESAKTAALAARELNRLFAQEMAVSLYPAEAKKAPPRRKNCVGETV